jgi:hypothetical protein
MYRLLQILTILLVSIGMALSLAHALELPGKLRLSKEEYLTVQPIYYPGFTVGGIFGEGGAIVATLALLILTPFDTSAFWLTLIALLALLVMHAIYWMLTHPVNDFWLKDERLHAIGAAFFTIGASSRPCRSIPQDWIKLRDQWEYSHIARAAAAMLSLIALVTAATIPGH